VALLENGAHAQYRIYISSSTRFTPKPYKSGRPSQWSVGKGCPLPTFVKSDMLNTNGCFSIHCTAEGKEGRKEGRNESTTNANESYMGTNFHLCTHFLWDKKQDSIRVALHHGLCKMAFSMVQLPWYDFLIRHANHQWMVLYSLHCWRKEGEHH
jgi:hypothetical protein